MNQIALASLSVLLSLVLTSVYTWGFTVKHQVHWFEQDESRAKDFQQARVSNSFCLFWLITIGQSLALFTNQTGWKIFGLFLILYFLGYLVVYVYHLIVHLYDQQNRHSPYGQSKSLSLWIVEILVKAVLFTSTLFMILVAVAAYEAVKHASTTTIILHSIPIFVGMAIFMGLSLVINQGWMIGGIATVIGAWMLWYYVSEYRLNPTAPWAIFYLVVFYLVAFIPPWKTIFAKLDQNPYRYY